MNRFLALLVAVATVALIGFGVVVFTSEGPRAPAPEGSAAPQATQAAPSEPEAAAVAAPEAPAEMLPATPEAAERFDAWAKSLRDDGLTVIADRVAVSGETLTVAGLKIAGPAEVPGWRWTTERASLYDRELFHLQAAGQTEFVIINGAGDETVWSGNAEAIGIALRRDERDVLARSLVVRVNGLALARAGDAAPFTLSDGQLRILLKGGTGLLTPGTDVVLRLTDLTLPSAAGSVLGSKVKSFTTEFPIDQPITGYSLKQVLDLVSQSSRFNLNLGSIALDWGALHFIGNGSLGLGPDAMPRGQLDVRVSDPMTLLDSIAAWGGMPAEAIADQQAALLLELGQNADDGAVPMSVDFQDGGVVLRGSAGEIPLSRVAPPVSGDTLPATVFQPSQ